MRYITPATANPRPLPWKAPKAPKLERPLVFEGGKVGSTVFRAGRSFQVWAIAPRGDLWLVPTQAQDGDAPVYRAGTSYATPCNSDGSTRYAQGMAA